MSPLALLCALAAAGCGGHEQHASAAHANAHPEGHYDALRVSREDVDLHQDYVAQIHAIQHIELRAQVHGYLQDTFVDEGQLVQEGTLMFQIMPALYQAELTRAIAEAAFVEQEYKNTELLARDKIVSETELALALAKLDKARAEVAYAQTHRDLTEIRAPFTGIVGHFHARKGSLLEDGELLTTLSDNSTVWVYYNVSEREYLRHRAQSANTEALPLRLVLANGKVFDQPGKLDTIVADFHGETGNIAFRASFPNPDGLLRHGQTGNVRVTDPRRGALLVLQKATFEILDRRYVFVVDEDHTVHQRRIVVAAEIPSRFVLESGLEEGELVLLEGLRKVRDGGKVQVHELTREEALESLEVHAE